MEGPAEGLTVAEFERKLESGLDSRPPITAGMCDVLFEGFFFQPLCGPQRIEMWKFSLTGK